jgi:hypothetical protein
MAILQVAAVLERDGWLGEAAELQDAGMLDDATYVLSEPRGQGEAVLVLVLGDQLPASNSELVVRCQRMCQGRVSGTGVPSPLTVQVRQGKTLVLEGTVTPGGSWRDERFGMAALPNCAEPLRVLLLVPAGERQVAVSRLRIEALELVDLQVVPDSAGQKQEVEVEVEVEVEEPVSCGVCPMPEPAAKPRRRARQKDGTYRGDDPATGHVNEAWEEADTASAV